MDRRRKNDESENRLVSNADDNNQRRIVFVDYIKFVFLSFFLIVPIYAIAKSAMKHDWIMMMVDALLIPVGFLHGLLMFFDFV